MVEGLIISNTLKIVSSIVRDSRIERLCGELRGRSGVVHVRGAWGSSAPMLAAIVADRLQRPLLYLSAHLEHADNARDDLEYFSNGRCDLFPAWETLPGEGAAAGEIDAERLRLCGRLHHRDANAKTTPQQLIVAPVQALMQPVPAQRVLRESLLHVAIGPAPDDSPARSPDALLAWAVDHGLARLDLVESPGDVARRGDIVDLFAPGESSPYRIQFFGDEVESIRRFDVSSQRSIEALGEMTVAAPPEEGWLRRPDAIAPFWDSLPPATLIVLDEPAEVQAMGETLASRVGESDRLFPVHEVLRELGRFGQLHLSAFGAAATSTEAVLDFDAKSLARFESDASTAVAELCALANKCEVHVVCDTDGERQRLREMIAESSGASATQKRRIEIHRGVIHRGFEWAATRTIVVPHHELFHRHRQRRRLRRLHAGRPLESWLDLAPGECVVHVVHGIALYRGLKRMQKGTAAQEEEFLSLEFADKAMVYVPCSQIDLVQKYIGSGGRRPELSKLGGKRWSKAKQQVADAVTELAESLLRIQAIRDSATGIPYPEDTEWQREFEAAFPYEETEDQLIVASEIRDDLMRPRPMDRLVCGDVGYGKTELAMRAAFKIVEYGRQVAILVPTTVLAEQHHATLRERMAEYPFTIACLSRFRSAKEQRLIIEELKKGRIDIVVGTHRLVSRDVAFSDLGLVIIDEEQRFGVEHKERLKAMRETIDVLTLSATPIPRTLHMSLMGIRDISSLQTPPVDRRAIATQVRPFSRELIRDAILREMNRDGQVYFIHNFVQSIAGIADEVRKIVPEARVIYGHGQMKDGELESVMHRFVNREADVLVSTTIIESGIDIPTVNTIFINRADRFGLADLHQLRGRVGRSDHRAYCYLLLPADRPLNRKATKRLKTIEEFSELGAGFRIAMRDLEIRGAGNLLGREQSGHIAAVGYEMYCRLLNQTVRRLKNEPDPTPPPVQLDLDVAAHIPRNYIAADRSRIEIYRRIVACQTEEDLAQLERDLLDAFGPAPPEVRRLLELAEIRVHARSYGILSVSLQPPDVVFGVKHLPSAEPVFLEVNGTVRMPDAQTVYFRPPPNYLEPASLLPVLRNMFVRAKARVESSS